MRSPYLMNYICEASEESKQANRPMQAPVDSSIDYGMCDKKLLERQQLESEPLQRRGMDIRMRAKMLSCRHRGEDNMQQSVDKSLR